MPLYDKFVNQIEMEFEKKIQTGIFGANMKIVLVNNGPVTIVIDTKNRE
jgi:D-tyrosyl-tRNA(Tyr) deacylase